MYLQFLSWASKDHPPSDWRKSAQAVYRPTQDVVSMRKAIVAKESMCSCCSDVANNASVSVNTSNEECSTHFYRSEDDLVHDCPNTNSRDVLFLWRKIGRWRMVMLLVA